MVIKIANSVKIGENFPTFVVAEAGINHNGKLKTALQMVTEAKNAGADAIKFQTYETIKRVKPDNPVYNILKQCELSRRQFADIIAFCRQKNIIFFSTPFDLKSLAFLVDQKVPLIKIASFDLVNIPFLKAIIKTKIPIIISRGMANEREINRALKLLKTNGSKYALLHCVSAYPLKETAANLKAIDTLKAKYDCLVGYSDHTLRIEVPVLAVAAGAKVIEKHFTLNKKNSGPDHKLSADPKEFGQMVKRIRQVEKIMGSGKIALSPLEKRALIFRRSEVS